MHTNRLAKETSPYLLQHAHNPVDWYPWGTEAFEEARRRNVPIFLSIGYSTCYWCHVMERESFEDEATAAVMNELFVCVKVDREERPDVDDLYMAATQMMTGSGGWPMSVFIEPESLRPFWCGTYFPREPMQGRPSFRQVLGGISNAWKTQRDEVTQQADELARAVRGHLAERDVPVALGATQIESATTALLQTFDRTEGGFGGAPKFPQPAYCEFLLSVLDHADEASKPGVAHAVRLTLNRMAVGGLFDQAGGGFHRYCVDRVWTVPHFEKMLYDNAQLVSLYADAAQRFDDPLYKLVVRRTLDYVLREMTDERGGFFSAQDAEVNGREGQNYVWTLGQAQRVLDEDELAFAEQVYAIGTPNFQDPHHPDEPQTAVLRLTDRPEVVASKLGIDAEEFQIRLMALNAKLYEARLSRDQPHLDDKVLGAWNGMMITAMVDGAELLDEPRYARAAARAAGFILGTMRTPEGRLLRSAREGVAKQGETNGAVLEDYAYLAEGLLALHRYEPESGDWLREAKSLLEVAHEDLGTNGTYYDTPLRDDLFVRARTTYDGAVPSGSSAMLHALLDMHEADPQGPWLDRAMDLLASLSPVIATQTVGTINSASGLLRVIGMGPGVRERLAFGPEPTTQGIDSGAMKQSPVEIFADTDEVTVSEDEPAEITLGLRIREGWHIMAAEPIAEGSETDFVPIPLRVGLVSGQGVAVYADYPEGEPYGAGLIGKDELRVHTAELRLTVAVERADGIGPSEGEPVLGITFQACTDDACMEPITLKLGVKVKIEK